MTAGATVAVIALVLVLAFPAATKSTAAGRIGSNASSRAAIDPATLPPMTRVVAPFDHPIRVEEAVQLASDRGVSIAGVRVENPTAEAEYTLTPDLTAAEFVEWFEGEFGVSPQAVGWIRNIERPVNANGTLADIPDEAAVITGLPEAVAAPTKEESSADQLREWAEAEAGSVPSGKSSTTAIEPRGSTGVGWRPNTVEVDIEPSSSTTLQFRQYAYWGNGSSPMNTYPGFGLEFQMDLFNNATGTRLPGDIGCSGSHNGKDAFIAKNYAYPAWGVTAGQSNLKSAVSAYADYNDIFDSCGRNSMSIGMRYPHEIPSFAPTKYTVLITILASRGNSTSSRLGSSIQQVNDGSCIVPGVALTDCMGVTNGAPPGGWDREGSRAILNENRRWVAAPSRCWVSNAFGYGSPVPTVPGTSDGCYH
ncbi:hypothetical protein ACFVWR_00675 [Leifsonia sp. NPDC058292]|uniref:hypothetical protein n=1 Tax=Leifsonia sp. NPDC058292 TaxID=3346428 RepID=UPI0036D9B98F